MKLSIIILFLFLAGCKQQSKDSGNHSNVSKDTLISATRSILLPDTVLQFLSKKYDMSSFNEIASYSDTANRRLYFLAGEYHGETFREEAMFLVLWNTQSGLSDDGKYSMAGQEYNYLDTLVYESRVFYGNCTKQFPRSVIWHQNTLMKTGGWKREFYVVDYSSGKFKGGHFPDNSINMNEILVNLKLNKCSELAGTSVKDEP